jgi:WD40 repeat protein
MGTSIQSYTEVIGGVLSKDFIRSVTEGTAKPVNEEPVRIQLDVTNKGTKYLRVKRYELYPFQQSEEEKRSAVRGGEKGNVVVINSIADLEQLLTRNGYQIAKYDTSRIRKLIDEVNQANRLQNFALKDTITTIQERITKLRGKIAEARGDKERDLAKRVRVEETTSRLVAELATMKVSKEKAEAELAVVQAQLLEKKRVSETIILKFALQASKGGQSPAEASIEAIIDKLDEVKNEARVQHSRETTEVTSGQLTAYQPEQGSTEARVTAVRLIALTNEGSNGVRVRVAFRVRTVMSESEQTPVKKSSSGTDQLTSPAPQKKNLKQGASTDSGQKKGSKRKKGSVKTVSPDKPPVPVLPPPIVIEPPVDTITVSESEQNRQAPLQTVENQQPGDASDVPEGAPMKSLTQHSTDILSVAYSGDGSRAASGGRDNNVIVWDTRSWSPIATLVGHRNNVQALAFSAKGRNLASGANDKSAIIWDYGTQKQLRKIETDKDVTTLAFNPSATNLAIGVKSKEITIWNIASGTKSNSVKSGNDVLALAYSPNGKLLATSGKEKDIRLWSLGGKNEERVLKGHNNDVVSLQFTPDGKNLVSGGTDKNVIVWDVVSGTLLKKLDGHKEKIVALAVTRDGRRLISADSQRSSGTIIIWDLKTGSIIKKINAQKKIECMALSPDGRHLIVGSDKTLLVYRLE